MTDGSSSVSSNGSVESVYPASTVRSLIRNHNNLVSHIDKLQLEAKTLLAENDRLKAQLKDVTEQKWRQILKTEKMHLKMESMMEKCSFKAFEDEHDESNDKD
ncbi:hypothetical protein L6452_08563 [Arctium lappa]|uniref:Uncharacterized protein n=1 Tax=Arctium lappa TaxID=4217 RepID=A0ACB9DI88_ARCLA|nr:hypothetical protein L6452_08563 [Arctium lappa]